MTTTRPTGKAIRRTDDERAALARMDDATIKASRKFWLAHAPAGKAGLFDAKATTEHGSGRSVKALHAVFRAATGTADPKSGWAFLTDSRLFQKIKTGVKLAGGKLRQAIEFVAGEGQKIAKKLAKMLVGGKVDVPTWQTEMESLIKWVHGATGIVGGGGKNAAGNAELKAIEDKVDHQLGFLEKFAVAVEEGLALNGSIPARAMQYLLAAVGTFEKARRIGDIDAGYTWEKRKQHSFQGCGQCVDYASQGWQPAGTLPDIGEECDCNSRCLCTFSRTRGKFAPDDPRSSTKGRSAMPAIARPRQGMPIRLIWEGALRGQSRDLSQVAGLVPGQSDVVPKRFAGGDSSVGYDLISGVAVIPVYGEIYRHATFLNDLISVYFGGTSVDQVSDALRAALADPDAKAILFTFDSPGGDVAGVGELASLIHAASQVKPVAGYAEYLCCSAAYWLASACGEITAAPTAIIGSIGVRTELVDDADYWEAMGISFTDVVADQSPNKAPDPSTDEGMQLYKDLLTATCQVFIADVATNRGVSVDKVQSDFGKGWVMLADKAKSVGMVDKVGTLDSVIQKMSGPNRARLAIKRTPDKMRLSLRTA